MAIPTRVIKRRIKSIRSTRKIMKAMELVAASKMRKATQLTLGTRPYASSIKDLTHEIRKLIDPNRHALLVGNGQPTGRPTVTILAVAASDRGLCGGFNSQLIKKSLEFLKSRPNDKVKIVTIGRRAEQVVKRGGFALSAAFESISNAPSFERTHPVATFLHEEFMKGNVDRIFLAFTTFKSALLQVPTVVQLLPITPEDELKKGTAKREETSEDENEEKEEANLLFEPDADAVLNDLLPRMIEMQIYQALLESSASEHSARMMAMRSAGDAASEMLGDLTFTLNQARQASITREISEISAGKAAIE